MVQGYGISSSRWTLKTLRDRPSLTTRKWCQRYTCQECFQQKYGQERERERERIYPYVLNSIPFLFRAFFKILWTSCSMLCSPLLTLHPPPQPCFQLLSPSPLESRQVQHYACNMYIIVVHHVTCYMICYLHACMLQNFTYMLHSLCMLHGHTVQNNDIIILLTYRCLWAMPQGQMQFPWLSNTSSTSSTMRQKTTK